MIKFQQANKFNEIAHAVHIYEIPIEIYFF